MNHYNFTEPISFLDTPAIQNASEHQDATIRCEVEGDPEPKVTWQVKGKHPQGITLHQIPALVSLLTKNCLLIRTKA